MIIYICFIAYCRIKFKISFFKAVVGTVLCISIIAILQFAVLILISIAQISNESVRGVLVNMFVFIMVAILVPKLRVDRFMDWMYRRDVMIYITLLVTIVIVAAIMYQNKVLEGIQGEIFFFSIPAALLLLIWAGRWAGNQEEKEKLERELQEEKLQQSSYDKLIMDTRIRQHNFNNQIAAILGTHYVYTTYEDLVRAQDEWCQTAQRESRDIKLLRLENNALAGFLYQKGRDAERAGIRIIYSVHGGKWSPGIANYLLIEMLGILIDNAVEAAREMGFSEIQVVFDEIEEYFVVLVMNQYEYVPYEMIEKWFELGKSRKSGERGIGLYRIRQICKEENCGINLKNKNIDGNNWIVSELFLIKKTGQN